MRRISTALIALVCVLCCSLVTALAQSAPADPSVTVPRLIQITGVFQPVDGQPPSAVEIVTLSVYADADGGLPVWQERQTVAIEKTTGRFTLLLGASHPAGIPAEVFASGDGQWMSLLFERAGEREQPRVRIASVPYALKASDAETLGGLPASAYLRAPTAASAESGSRETSTVTSAAVTATEGPSLAAVLPGTTNFLAKYVNGADVGNSAVYETPTATVPTGAVGIGTTAPLDQLHLRFNNTNGAITGLAVQNLGNTTTSYSGMLFYDQFGALGAVPGLQQRDARIPDQQHRHERVDQLHDGQHVALLRRAQRQHRHRHRRAGAEAARRGRCRGERHVVCGTVQHWERANPGCAGHSQPGCRSRIGRGAHERQPQCVLWRRRRRADLNWTTECVLWFRGGRCEYGRHAQLLLRIGRRPIDNRRLELVFRRECGRQQHNGISERVRGDRRRQWQYDRFR